MRQLEVSLLGGWTEKRLRKRRSAVTNDLPWGTIDPARYVARELDLARAMWTNGIFTEYASATAFSQLATALLECGAPIDLSAACADIVVDEMTHVELVTRVVIEMGGATPYDMDLSAITQLPECETPLMRAAELAITTSCVGESLSVPALRQSLSTSNIPLLQGVLERLVKDEGPHAQLGLAFLTWASDQLTRGDREMLARIAVEAIAVYAPLWQRPAGDESAPACAAPELGLSEPTPYRALMTAAVDKIDLRLCRCGIVMDRAAVSALL
jgi:hypothetical protein